jgi:hypothetical protein
MSSDYTAAILEELRAMNRKLATMGKISETLSRDFSALAERVQLAIGDIPAPDALTASQELIPPEPPVGSIVRDCEGDEWLRGPDGWGIRRAGRINGNDPWTVVVEYSPLVLVKKGDDGA